MLPKNGNLKADAATATPTVTWSSDGCYQYYKAGQGDGGWGLPFKYEELSTTVNPAYGKSEFDPVTATATHSKNNIGKSKTVASYVKIKAEITVPACTEYKVDYKATINMTHYAGASSNNTGFADFYIFGDEDTSSTLTFGVNRATVETGYAGTCISRTHTWSYTGTSGVSSTKDIDYTVNYINEESKAKTFTTYFGVLMNTLPSTAYSMWFDGTTTMSDTVTFVQRFGTVIPTVDPLTYNGANQDFIITDFAGTDTTLVDVNYTDMTGDTKNLGISAVTGDKLTAKDAGRYTLKFKRPTGADDPTMWSDGSTDEYCEVVAEMKSKTVTLPAISDSEQTYKGAEYSFDLDSNYKTDVMEMTRPAGISWDVGKNEYSDGLKWIEADKQFKAKNANEYKLIFRLKDKNNYAWAIGGGTTADQTATIMIKPKELTAVLDSTTDNSMEWSLGDSGTVTVKPVACDGDDVSLALYYVGSNGVERSNGVSGHSVDVSKISSIGEYSLRVKLTEKSDNGYKPDNANYTISGAGAYDIPDVKIKIKAGGVVAGSLTWLYRRANEPIDKEFISGGAQTLLEYEPDASKAYIVTARGNDYMKVMTGYTANSYVNGFKTVAVAADGTETPVIGGECTAVGKYRTYVAIEIDNPDYEFGVSNRFDPDNAKQGWLALDWEITPRTLDFADAKWVYSKGGDDISFDGGNPEYNNGLLITVKLDPGYINGLGLAEGDYVITYRGDVIKKDKGEYKAKAEIVILNTNYKTPETADGSDYTIEYGWKITNKQIGIKNWNGKKSVQSDDKVFTIPVITAQDGKDYSAYLVYTYTATLKRDDGSTYEATGGEEVLLEAAKQASPTNQISITVTVGIDPLKKDSFDLTGPTTHTFEMGDSKEAITVSLVYNNVQYGDVKFDLKADGYLEYITVTVTSALLDNAVTVQGSNLSALMEYLVKAGDYSISLELGGVYADAFALFPNTLTFTIVPKQVYIPEVNAEIVFTGENINLANYLDGYDASIMTLDALEKRDAGTYTATITLKDQFNYVFVKKPVESEETPAKATAKASLTGYETGVDFTNDEHTAVEMQWKINPYVLDGSRWNLKGKTGAEYSLPDKFAAMIADGTLELSVGYRYYEDKNGAALGEVTFRGGNTFYVEALLDGADAGNFVFENGTVISEKVTYQVPKSTGGFSGAVSTVKDFVTKTWLGLPIWAWLLIGLAVLILLIIIIAVASKRRKSKEEREAKKAAKEEERQRREEERRLQQERLEAERELARAKQEAELEKIRAQAGMAAGMGMATMSMQQPQQQPQAQPVQQQVPVQQAQQVQQPIPMAQQMPQPQAAGGMNATEMMAMMFAQFAGMKAENADKEIAALKSEKEITALKTELEIMKLKMEQLKDARVTAADGKIRELSPEFLGAVIASAVRNNGVLPQPAAVAELPAPEPETANMHAVYPPDAVVTTTTTVDTTQKQPKRIERDSRNDFADVDGFYDSID